MATKSPLFNFFILACFVTVSADNTALLAATECQQNSSVVVELRALIESFRKTAPQSPLSAADRQTQFLRSAPERFVPLFDQWMWDCWLLERVGYRPSDAGHLPLLRVTIKSRFPIFRLDDVTSTLTPIPAGRLYVSVEEGRITLSFRSWSSIPLQLMDALRSLGINDKADFRSLFRHIDLGPLLSTGLWRPAIEFNMQEEQSRAIMFDLSREPGQYRLDLDKASYARVKAHYGLDVSADSLSYRKKVERRRLASENALRISWCQFDATLFPFDRTFCFLGFSMERPRDVTLGMTDRAAFSSRFPWARASTLAYRNNITTVAINLRTKPFRKRRTRYDHARGQAAQPIMSDDHEWAQAWRGLFCAYVFDDGQLRIERGADINCLSAFMLERKPIKYVYPWLVTINILAVSAVVSVYIGNGGGYGIVTSAMVPMGTFLFTLDSQVPNTANHYPIVGFYTLGMLVNTLVSMMVSNMPFVLTTNSSVSTIAAAVVTVHPSRTAKPTPIRRTRSAQSKKRLRNRLLFFFLLLHAGINAWALSRWLHFWDAPDLVPLAALGSRQFAINVAEQFGLLSEDGVWTPLRLGMFSDQWICKDDQCRAVDAEEFMAVCQAETLDYCY